jgi:hypothetical protein
MAPGSGCNARGPTLTVSSLWSQQTETRASAAVPGTYVRPRQMKFVSFTHLSWHCNLMDYCYRWFMLWICSCSRSGIWVECTYTMLSLHFSTVHFAWNMFQNLNNKDIAVTASLMVQTFFQRIPMLPWVTLDLSMASGMNECIWVHTKNIFPNCELIVSIPIEQIKLQMQNIHTSLTHLTSPVTLACLTTQTHFQGHLFCGSESPKY